MEFRQRFSTFLAHIQQTLFPALETVLPSPLTTEQQRVLTLRKRVAQPAPDATAAAAANADGGGKGGGVAHHLCHGVYTEQSRAHGVRDGRHVPSLNRSENHADGRGF